MRLPFILRREHADPESLQERFARAIDWLAYSTIGLFLLVIALGSGALYLRSNDLSRQLEQNKALIERHNQALVQICQATQTIEIVLSVFISTGQDIVRAAELDARGQYQRQLNALQVARVALAATTACHRVTG